MKTLTANYQSLLDLSSSESAIELVKSVFSKQLSQKLELKKVSAPIFVMHGTGLNDDLNGIERPVSFPVKSLMEARAEIVHSLAKWKRLRLAQLGIPSGKGLYTDMRALRPDEDLSPIHSVYVDQWDWEKHIESENRSLSYLRKTVERIYEAIKATEQAVYAEYPEILPMLPEKIHFISAEALLNMFPDLSPKEREDKIAKIFGAVFVMGIGGALSHGEEHDGRAPDYDDWSTENEEGFKGLNGDILVWNPVLERAFELSSMGIRVDKKALTEQLKIRGCEKRSEMDFHRMLLQDEIPLSIGGGIGQSRLCMFLLRKAHIGEVQVSIWPEEMHRECLENGIELM